MVYREMGYAIGNATGGRAYYACHKPEFAERNKKWRENNKEKRAIYVAQYRIDHKEEIIAQRDRYKPRRTSRVKKRFQSDPLFKLLEACRHRIHVALKGNRKSDRTEELIGCSFEDLKVHLESKLTEGMTWENYGPVWHIDHIMPCSHFDLSQERELKDCFNFKNLQPLYA